MTRAIAYLRVSTQLQASDGLGLDVQQDKVSRYAVDHGLELVDVVREAASGGVTEGEVFSWEHRPRLHALIGRAEAGDYDVLLVAKFDRLSRDYASLVAIERRMRLHGVELVSADEDNGDSATAKLMRHTLAGFAEFERAIIRERLSEGKAKARQAGRHAAGAHPYGYHAPARRSYLEPHPEQAEVVRRIFQEARDGRSTVRIARNLNAAGIPSPRGKLWTPGAVRNIIINPVYTGERDHVKKAHAAIVSRRLFNAAGAALRQRLRR